MGAAIDGIQEFQENWRGKPWMKLTPWGQMVTINGPILMRPERSQRSG